MHEDANDVSIIRDSNFTW